MDNILTEIKANPCLKLIINTSKKYPQEIYLVGGYLRDLFLRRRKDAFDFDFAVSSCAIKISREIAASLKSPFVVLDKEHGSSRIVYRKGRLSCNFDFTAFRGSAALSARGRDIQGDLLHRDFTLNSMALDLKEIGRASCLQDVLLDPYGGREDIKNRVIRKVSDFSLPEDPLRILRAFSLSAVLNFKVEPQTLRDIKKYREKITSCAFERITEELFKILDSENAFKTFKAMDGFRILDEIIPEIKVMRKVSQGPYHHLDVYNHCLEALKQIESLFSELKRDRDMQNYLNEKISGARTRRALLKLGAFLHDIGKPASKERLKGKTCFHGHERVGRNIVRAISERLRLSNDERGALDRMIFWHLRPGYMADIENLSRRAEYKYFRDTAAEAAGILLLSIADQRSTRGVLTRGANRKHHEEVCLGLAEEFFRRAKKKELPRLINGDDLIRKFRLSPGPLIGKILEELREAQGAGEIGTRAQAMELAGEFIKRGH